jgi:hypothetical protein
MKYVFSQSGVKPVELTHSPIYPSGSIVALRSTNMPTQSPSLGIPPERVGLQGEYDHSGLAKRVHLMLHQELGEPIADRFHVSQRGQVVILVGDIASAAFAQQLADLVLNTPGAAFVEIHDLKAEQSEAA